MSLVLQCVFEFCSVKKHNTVDHCCQLQHFTPAILRIITLSASEVSLVFTLVLCNGCALFRPVFVQCTTNIRTSLIGRFKNFLTQHSKQPCSYLQERRLRMATWWSFSSSKLGRTSTKQCLFVINSAQKCRDLHINVQKFSYGWHPCGWSDRTYSYTALGCIVHFASKIQVKWRPWLSCMSHVYCFAACKICAKRFPRLSFFIFGINCFFRSLW